MAKIPRLSIKDSVAEARKYYADKGRKYRRAAKEEAIRQYGKKCKCCGEADIRFLTIDHSRNDGGKFRKSITRSYTYTWLKVNGYPKNLGLQVMCFQCNCGRNANGGICPHKDPL